MSKISVVLRIKPEDSLNVSKNIVFSGENASSVDVLLSGMKHEFQFDRIFSSNASQEDLFSFSASSIVDSALEGYNGCVMTYGQTGAGKTYTMTGPSTDTYQDRGIVHRTTSALFQRVSQLSDTITIRLSVLEIYNETLVDLLREPSAAPIPPNSTPIVPKLTIIESPGGVNIPALYVLPVATEIDAVNVLLEAYGNRVVGEHQLNRKSSRSHVIYTFYLTRTRSEDDVVQSKLHLIDLAGSERVHKTGSSGTVQKEASYINKSLSFLEQVVLALSQSRRDHIPYRQSKLTYLLKDSLGGNCATLLIACVWPHRNHEWETLSTLRFGTRMKCIENHPIRNNLISKEPLSSRLLQQIDQLKRELSMRDILNQQDPWLPELSTNQRLRTLKSVMTLLSECPRPSESNCSVLLSSSSTPNPSILEEFPLEIRSLSQAKYMIEILRYSCWLACEENSNSVKAIAEKVVDNLSQGRIKSLPTSCEVVTKTSIDSSSEINDDVDDDENGNGQENPSLSNIVLSGDDDQGAQESSQVNKSLTFEEFSQGPGKDLYFSFQEAREALKANKARQKDIIMFLNNQKELIDDCSRQLRSINESDDDIDSRIVEEIQFKLDSAKREYRGAHGELQYCKAHVSELENLKQRAMQALLKSFEEYTSTSK